MITQGQIGQQSHSAVTAPPITRILPPIRPAFEVSQPTQCGDRYVGGGPYNDGMHRSQRDGQREQIAHSTSLSHGHRKLHDGCIDGDDGVICNGYIIANNMVMSKRRMTYHCRARSVRVLHKADANSHKTTLMQPSFSGLFVIWAYLPKTTLPPAVTSASGVRVCLCSSYFPTKFYVRVSYLERLFHDYALS
jgi:hypothetical protein